MIMSLERDQQNEELKNFCQIRLLKDRDLGDTGPADVLQYHPDTGRLLVSETNPFEDGPNPFKKESADDF